MRENAVIFCSSSYNSQPRGPETRRDAGLHTAGCAGGWTACTLLQLRLPGRHLGLLSCAQNPKINAFPFISFSDSPQIEGDFPLQEGTAFSILCSRKSPENIRMQRTECRRCDSFSSGPDKQGLCGLFCATFLQARNSLHLLFKKYLPLLSLFQMSKRAYAKVLVNCFVG